MTPLPVSYLSTELCIRTFYAMLAYVLYVMWWCGVTEFQDEMQRLVNVAPNPSDPSSPLPGDPPSTHPEREESTVPLSSPAIPYILTPNLPDPAPPLSGPVLRCDVAGVKWRDRLSPSGWSPLRSFHSEGSVVRLPSGTAGQLQEALGTLCRCHPHRHITAANQHNTASQQHTTPTWLRCFIARLLCVMWGR